MFTFSDVPTHPCIDFDVNCGEAGCMLGANGDPMFTFSDVPTHPCIDFRHIHVYILTLTVERRGVCWELMVILCVCVLMVRIT